MFNYYIQVTPTQTIMKKVLLSLCITLGVYYSSAQKLAVKASSGDAELDIALDDINKTASADLKLFKKDLSVGFGITEGKLDKLSVEFGMGPADLYFALELSKQANKPIDVVAQTYKTHKAKGWGVIAKELGIKPGSKAFHALKNAAKGKSKKMKEKKNKSNGKGNSKKGETPSATTGTDAKKSESTDTGGGNGKGNGNGKGKGKK
jgi:hypothetical protein